MGSQGVTFARYNPNPKILPGGQIFRSNMNLYLSEQIKYGMIFTYLNLLTYLYLAWQLELNTALVMSSPCLSDFVDRPS